jgi:hypothetical protein
LDEKANSLFSDASQPNGAPIQDAIILLPAEA